MTTLVLVDCENVGRLDDHDRWLPEDGPRVMRRRLGLAGDESLTVVLCAPSHWWVDHPFEPRRSVEVLSVPPGPESADVQLERSLTDAIHEGPGVEKVVVFSGDGGLQRWLTKWAQENDWGFDPQTDRGRFRVQVRARGSLLKRVVVQPNPDDATLPGAVERHARVLRSTLPAALVPELPPLTSGDAVDDRAIVSTVTGPPTLEFEVQREGSRVEVGRSPRTAPAAWWWWSNAHSSPRATAHQDHPPGLPRRSSTKALLEVVKGPGRALELVARAAAASEKLARVGHFTAPFAVCTNGADGAWFLLLRPIDGNAKEWVHIQDVRWRWVTVRVPTLNMGDWLALQRLPLFVSAEYSQAVPKPAAPVREPL